MLRVFLLLLAVLVPVGLVYACGWWVLLALFGVSATTLFLSTRQASGAEATQGGTLTEYGTTTMANL